MASGAYDYSDSFQEKILAMLWRDATFYSLYQEVIKPQYFEKDIHIDLARIILNFYEQYNLQPSLEAVLEEVRVLCNGSRVKKEKFKDYLQAVEHLMEMDLRDIQYVRDKVVSFGQKQALTEAILASVDDIQKGNDFGMVKKRIEDASQVGANIGDFGTFYFDTIDERMDAYHKRDEAKIPTGIELLDQVMAGGLGRGELGIVLAPPGSGKTLTLINFGASATQHGLNTAHFSLEMNEEKITQRYDTRFTEKNFEYIRDNKDSVTNSLKSLAKMSKGRLVVKSFPTRTLTVDGIRSYLTKVKLSENFVPDLEIIDYPDIMKPSRTYDVKRHELELLYEELRAIAQEFNFACWGASQTNRAALAKKVVTMADLAESFGKAAVSDFMIALSQTKKEKRNGEVRYYVAKHRNGMSDETIHCDIWYDKMKVQSNAERETSFDMEDDEDDDAGEWKERKHMVAQYKKNKEKAKEQQRAEKSVDDEISSLLKKGDSNATQAN
jgi:replicative DNA helicase